MLDRVLVFPASILLKAAPLSDHMNPPCPVRGYELCEMTQDVPDLRAGRLVDMMCWEAIGLLQTLCLFNIAQEHT